ncbi:MAG: alpha-amylase family glycosyl hydrolase [Bacteroidota bacterium]
MHTKILLISLCLVIDLEIVHGQKTKIIGQNNIPDAPSWVADAVFYQIYPQTYYDSNGDGIGDLNGIIQKLDYIKSLGVTAIWLNPFFDSPFNDAGYDTRDYYKVAPRYGTNEDAKRLFQEAHKHGLKVIFDYVITYTAIDHPWFVESCKGTSNKYTNWYVWNDNVWKMEEGEFANRFIQGYGQRNGNFMRNFYWSEPALNFGFGKPDSSKAWQLPTNHPDVLALREELKKIFCFWMDMGADGIRADMAGALVKGNDVNGDTKKFWKEIRQIVKEKYPQAFMVSEWSYPKDALDAFHADFFHWFDGFNDLTQKESWRILNGYSEGHSFFDKEGKGNIAYFLSKYIGQYNETKSKGYIILPLGNHDNARMNVNRTPDELELIMAFGITMPGVPFIYYGNEIGMRQLYDIPQIEGAYKPRAGARTPMQWTSGTNRGFSSADFSKLYLPVDTSNDAPNVETEQKDPASLLNRVKMLIHLKHTEPALAAYADFTPLYAKENTYPFIYSRTNGSDILLVIINPAEKAAKAEFQISVPYEKLYLLAGKKMEIRKKDKTISLDAPGISYSVYKLK